MELGRKMTGNTPVTRGSQAVGASRRHMHPPRVHIQTLTAVGLLEVGHLTILECRRRILSIALTRGAADGSTAKVGAKSRPGPDSGSPDPRDGTADIERDHRDVRLEMRGVCFIRRSTWPHASDGDAGDGRLFCPPVKKDRGGISLSAFLKHCFSLCVSTL